MESAVEEAIQVLFKGISLYHTINQMSQKQSVASLGTQKIQ